MIRRSAALFTTPLTSNFTGTGTAFLLFTNDDCVISSIIQFHSRASPNVKKDVNPSRPSRILELEKLLRDSGGGGIGNINDALILFDKMLQRRPMPSIMCFNQLLGVIAIMNHYSTVISLSKQMGMLGIMPDVSTLSIMINCFIQLNQMGCGFSVFGKLLKLGFEPNAKTMTTLIKGLCKMGNTSGAIQLLRKMEGVCKPDVVTFNTIIDSFCKDGLITEALNLFSEMINKGIPPNVVTYSSLIHGACNLGRWKDATRLLNEMVSKKIEPNVQTFTVLVNAYCKEGLVEEAQYVVE